MRYARCVATIGTLYVTQVEKTFLVSYSSVSMPLSQSSHDYNIELKWGNLGVDNGVSTSVTAFVNRSRCVSSCDVSWPLSLSQSTPVPFTAPSRQIE